MRKRRRIEAGSQKADEPSARYDEHWIRYIVCAGAPFGAFLFLFIARRYSEEVSLLEQNLSLDSITPLPPPDVPLILSGRVTWAVFNVLFYAAVSATAYFGILYIIPKALEKHLKPYKIILIAVLTPVIALGIGLFNKSFQSYLPLPTKLLELTINRNYGKTQCRPFHGKTPIIQCKMESDELWVYATHAFLASLCMIIIYAASQDTKRMTEPESNLDQIERRLLLYMKLLRLSLYLGAAVLVTEILNVNALLHWPLAYLDKQGAAYGGSIDRLVSALITERAVNYTGFLALLYIPSFHIFKEDAYRVACHKLPDNSLAEREAWLKEQGIAFSIWEYLPRAVAILGPLLSTPLSELIRHVLG
ncbi:MAG TPA: hypothetical protein VF544_13980 [Pyrinomonadaceae bacterium]|jgi:hypothetical protein